MDNSIMPSYPLIESKDNIDLNMEVNTLERDQMDDLKESMARFSVTKVENPTASQL